MVPMILMILAGGVLALVVVGVGLIVVAAIAATLATAAIND
jgi:hypothetical protein